MASGPSQDEVIVAAARFGRRCKLDRGRLVHLLQPRLFDSNLQEKSGDIEEQIQCRGTSPIAVLTVRLIGPHVNYGIVRASAAGA